VTSGAPTPPGERPGAVAATAPEQPAPQAATQPAATNGAEGDVILEVTDIHTYYGSIHALKGVTLQVRKGEVVTLIGANGAGKSTTLRSINGLNHPRKGRIVFQGRDITNGSRSRRRAAGSSRT
jgi:ABC-type transporter Mla maintaining outer membrane lipid asymmetry ATPase subunit MlaF